MMAHVKVYIDGACRNNGHNNPQGGCGVYWEPIHPLNSNEKLRGEQQTNNRAELSAAIMAVSQGITLGFTELEIITDSKYVKLGITKWIHEWKINGWKTAKAGKKKGDVLNKDLWVMLDALSDQLNIIWTWVEGHQEVEGNLQADTLAKKGIAVDRYVWQDIGMELCRNMNIDCGLDDNNGKMTLQKTPEKAKNSENTRFSCRSCSVDCIEGENSIQCHECKSWTHYNCSKLPPYQLFLYETTQRKYTCEFCADIDEEIIKEYMTKEEIKKEYKTNTEARSEIPTENGQHRTMKISTVSTQTDASFLRTDQTSTSSQTEGPILTDERLETKDLSESKLCQREEQGDSASNKQVYESPQTGEQSTRSNCIDQDSMSSQTEEPFYDFQLFKTSTITILQESFVTAFDKINESIRTMNKNQSEIDDMKQCITRLTKENEKLKESGSKELKDVPKAKIDCQNCNDSTARIEKLNKILATEKEKSQKSLHNITIEKENQISKIEAETGLMRHKLEISEKRNKMLDQEINALEKRLEVKNDCISTLEAQIGNMSHKISKMEDEIMSWKLHECRAEKEKGFQQVKEKCQNVTDQGANASTNINKDTEKDDNHQTPTKGPQTKSAKAPQSQTSIPEDTLEQNIDSKKPKVKIVGTSNIKYISPDYIGEKEFEVSKVTKYTLDETKTFVEELSNKEVYDSFILHSLCNDVSRKSPEECSEQMKGILNIISKKYKEVKVIVSLGLPRSDNNLNCRIEKTNVLIKELTSEMENVYICDNSNLFYRGEAQKGILNEDGIHLARDGTRKLGRNMKEALWGTFDIPFITRLETNKESHDRIETPVRDPNSHTKSPQNTTGGNMTKPAWKEVNRQNPASFGSLNEEREYHYKSPQNGQNDDRQWYHKTQYERQTYHTQDRDRGRQYNYDTRDRNRQHDAWDDDRESQYKRGTHDVEERQSRYRRQGNNWRSQDYGRRQSHDNREMDRGSNNNRNRERLWHSDHGLADQERGSYYNRGTHYEDWRADQHRGSRRERRSQYYWDQDNQNYYDKNFTYYV